MNAIEVFNIEKFNIDMQYCIFFNINATRAILLVTESLEPAPGEYSQMPTTFADICFYYAVISFFQLIVCKTGNHAYQTEESLRPANNLPIADVYSI